jgi:hypothetical protein
MKKRPGEGVAARQRQADDPRNKSGFGARLLDGAIGAAVTTIIAAILWLFTPLARTLVPDYGSIRIEAPETAVVDEPFDVEAMIEPITPQLRTASLAFEDLSKSLKLNFDRNTFMIEPITAARRFSDLRKPGLKLTPSKEGEANFVIRLRSGDRQLDFKPGKIIVKSHRAYRGEWDLDFAGTKGTLHLDEINEGRPDVVVYGYYALRLGDLTPRPSTVLGRFDGQTFSGTFNLGESAGRWQVTAVVADDGTGQSATGTAELMEARDGSWQAGTERVAFVMKKRTGTRV